VIGPALRSAIISYYESRAKLERDYREWKERKLPAARDSAAMTGGSLLSEGARRLLLLPYRQERVDPPTPLSAGGRRFDVVDDLVGFTSLPRESVEMLLARRVESFRTEWLQTPTGFRSDGWFYLSSKMYLFGNAVHFHDDPTIIESIAELLAPGAHVLDFGGGTANLSLAMAAQDFRVGYSELSALQKDFARFRVQRHGLQDRIEILDTWAGLPTDTYDAVLAFDVFEHLPNLEQTIEQIARSLVDGGLLVDTPSFSRGTPNPMHHEDPGLESFLASHRVVLDQTLPSFRVWKKRAG
jgi:SAM-dependent methyltransferase